MAGSSAGAQSRPSHAPAQFVAHTLNVMAYGGRRRWESVSLASLIFFRGRFVSAAAVAKTWLPFAALMALGGYFGGLRFLFGWAAAVGALLACPT